MDFEKLHKQFKDKDSNSYEGQRNWLRKKGFTPKQIDRTMLTFYGDIERGQLPCVFEGVREIVLNEKRYGMYGSKPPDGFTQRPIKTGAEMDNSLLEYANYFKAQDAKREAQGLIEFERMLKKRWMSQVPLWKRIFGVKPKE